jgi:nuclear transport factor 2 (NTF2) superfamily protein
MQTTSAVVPPTGNAYQDVITEVVRKFNTLDYEQMLSCFTDDVVTHYNHFPEIRGKATLRGFVRRWYSDISEYALEKRIRTVQGNTVGIDAQATYRSKADGKRYRILFYEFLDFEGELISRWDYIGISFDHVG